MRIKFLMGKLDLITWQCPTLRILRQSTIGAESLTSSSEWDRVLPFRKNHQACVFYNNFIILQLNNRFNYIYIMSFFAFIYLYFLSNCISSLR